MEVMTTNPDRWYALPTTCCPELGKTRHGTNIVVRDSPVYAVCHRPSERMWMIGTDKLVTAVLRGDGLRLRHRLHCF